MNNLGHAFLITTICMTFFCGCFHMNPPMRSEFEKISEEVYEIDVYDRLEIEIAGMLFG